MKKLVSKLNKNSNFNLLLLVTFAVAIFFRAYNYFERINIHSDHSLFTQAAFYAADNLIFPQIGPFAQAPFFTGPWWLWFLEIIYLLPFGFLTPWFVMSFLSIVFVALIFWLGKEVGGKWLGLIASFLAAISPAQISNSFSVWNAAIDPFLALLAIIFLVRFYNYKKALDIFLLGFSISLAITIHFQTALLLPLVLAGIIVARFKIWYITILIVGLLIPILPFIIFDLRNNWFWFVSFFIYVTVDQYAIWVPNRWLTYAGSYWPNTWAGIVGGNQIIGGVIMFLLSLFTIVKLRDFRKYKRYFLLALSFILMVIMFRYYRGERFFYFSNFAHPAVIFFTSWVIVELYKYKKAAGLILGIIIVVFTLNQSFISLKSNRITLAKIDSLKNVIYSNFPSNNFKIYGCSRGGALLSHPLALSMYSDKRDSPEGINIGVCLDADNLMAWNVISDRATETDGSPWLNHSSKEIYTSMTGWWKLKPPSGGNFWEYIKTHLDPKCHPYC